MTAVRSVYRSKLKGRRPSDLSSFCFEGGIWLGRRHLPLHHVLAQCSGSFPDRLPAPRVPANLTEDGQHSAALRQLQGILGVQPWPGQLRFLPRSATGVSTRQGRSTFATKLSSLECLREGVICLGLVRSTATSKAAAAIERAGMKFAFSARGP